MSIFVLQHHGHHKYQPRVKGGFCFKCHRALQETDFALQNKGLEHLRHMLKLPHFTQKNVASLKWGLGSISLRS